MVAYVIYAFQTQKRTKLLHELFFVGFYVIIAIFFAFPDLLLLIERTLGISSAINFFVYIAIFVAYVLLLSMYKKFEKQRIEITTLTREISLLHHDANKKKRNKDQ
jgi:hypothetical protein